ncbi:MAG: DUF1631 family protein, partial [Burkholderiaceae bacterium]
MNAPFVDAALSAACTRIQTAVQGVAQRLVDQLSQRAGGFSTTVERQARTNAHFDLSRKLPLFARIFADTLRERVLEAARPPKKSTQPLAAFDADTLSLVDEHEVDDRVASERIAAQILQRCEQEFIQLGAYSASLLQQPMLEPQHNPLRPELIARALRRAIQAATDDPAARVALESAFTTELAALMGGCYNAIVADPQERGLKPTVLSVRTVQGPGNELPREVHREVSGYRTSGFGASGSGFLASSRDLGQAEQMLSSLFGMAIPPGQGGGASLFERDVVPTRAPGPSGYGASGHGASGGAARDAHMLSILRRLSALSADGAFGPHASGVGLLGAAVPSASGFLAGGLGAPVPIGTVPGGAPTTTSRHATTTTRGPVTPLAGLMAVNVIRQHREELVRASTGALDHMVIDVVGALFDQVLSD